MNIENVPFIKIKETIPARPMLPVTIINPHTGKSFSTYGLIDTGADECAFPAVFAEAIGHNLLKGIIKEVQTGNGKTSVYSHTVKMDINGIQITDTLIDFMPNLHMPLLGVRSFLSKFTLIIDYPNKVFSLIEK